MTIKNNLSESFSYYLTIVPIIFFVTFLLTINFNTLNPIMIGFMITYVYTVIFSIRYYGFLSIYNIFLYTSAFFIYDCFFFTVFLGENFLLQTFPTKHLFSEEIGLKFIIICWLTVYIMHITYCLFPKKKYPSIPFDKNFNQFGKIIMIVFFIPVMVKLIIQFNFIRINGYLSMYTDAFAEIKYPVWTSGSFIFFTSGYCIFLASFPKQKEYLIYTFLCALVYFANALKGQRGGFLSIILYFVFFYTKHYNIKLKLNKVILLVVIGVIFIGVMGNVRTSYGDSKKSDLTLDTKELIHKLVYTQTTTRAVPMYIIQGGLKYHDYPFILSSFISPYLQIKYPSEGGQTDVVAKHYNKTTAVITYNISKRAYLGGNGIGSAFIGEAYDFFGFIGIILFSILLSIFFVFCDSSRLHVKRSLIPLLFFILQGMPILPRANIFRFIDLDGIKILFAYFIYGITTVLPIICIVKKRKIK